MRITFHYLLIVGVLSIFSFNASAKCDSCIEALRKLLAFNAETEKLNTLSERATLKPFPWPKGEFLLDDAKSGLVAVSASRMGEISSQVRFVCDRWPEQRVQLLANLMNLQPVEQNTVRMLEDGADAIQLALYGDLMHLIKLQQKGDTKRIVEVFESIRAGGKETLAIEFAPGDSGEATIFTSETLRCYLNLFYSKAAAVEFTAKPKNLAAVVSDVLQHWPTLKHHIKLVGDPREALLLAQGKQRDPLLNMLYVYGDFWEKTAAIEEFKGLAGAMETEEGLHLFYRLNDEPFSTVLISADGVAKQLSHAEASAALNSYVRKEMTAESTQAFRLFEVMPNADGYSLGFPNGKLIAISHADFSKLSTGEALAETHPLSVALRTITEDSLALYTHPLMMKPGPEMKAGKDLTFAIQKAYPKVRIHRDPIGPATSDRAKALNSKTLSGLDDLLVLMAEDSFKVPHNATIKNIAADLTHLGLKPMVFTGQRYDGPRGRGVIVITGHTSDRLASYVRAVGDAGYFRDNYVIFNSCEAPLTEQLMNELTSRYGAAGAFGFEKKIEVDDVASYVLSLVKKVREKLNQNLFQVLIETLQENHLNGVWSICRLNDVVEPICLAATSTQEISHVRAS